MLEELKKKRKVLVTDFLYFIAGSILFGLALNSFTAPNHIASGGVSGISILLNYLFKTPIGVTIFLINIPIFLWAVSELGYQMVLKTIVATFLSSAIIDLMSLVVPVYHGNQMLAAIFGGALDGTGLSLFFIRGATTGGTDLIARLLGRRFRHVSMGKLLLSVDGVIIVASGFVYQSLESSLYALIAIFVSTRIIDTILYGTDIGTGKVLFIMSEKNSEIAQQILMDMGRGVTALKSRGMYSGNDSEVLLCAVRRYEAFEVNDIVRSIDPNAFVIVGDAGEISGEGFREVKQDEKTLKDILLKRKKEKS